MEPPKESITLNKVEYKRKQKLHENEFECLTSGADQYNNKHDEDERSNQESCSNSGWGDVLDQYDGLYTTLKREEGSNSTLLIEEGNAHTREATHYQAKRMR